MCARYQGWSSPYYNETHRNVRRLARQFVDNEVPFDGDVVSSGAWAWAACTLVGLVHAGGLYAQVIPYVHKWDEAKKIPKEFYLKVCPSSLSSPSISRSALWNVPSQSPRTAVSSLQSAKSGLLPLMVGGNHYKHTKKYCTYPLPGSSGNRTERHGPRTSSRGESWRVLRAWGSRRRSSGSI